ALPRGNQSLAAGVVVRRGLTVRQTATLVRDLVDAADPDAEQAVLTRWGEGPPPTSHPRERASRSVVETMALDIMAIRRSAGRLESCLITTPLTALGPGASELVRESLGEL